MSAVGFYMHHTKGYPLQRKKIKKKTNVYNHLMIFNSVILKYCHFPHGLLTETNTCSFSDFSLWVKFSKKPSVFVTVAHHHAGLKRDAASIWLEDVTRSSFKICLRELQNYAGSHEDIYVVC